MKEFFYVGGVLVACYSFIHWMMRKIADDLKGFEEKDE